MISLPYQGAAGSRLVQRLRRRYGQVLTCLPPGPPGARNLHSCYQ